MKPLVPRDAVLCSDGGNGYANLAATGGIEHIVVGSKPRTRVAAGCYHIQNVNSLHGRYGSFISHSANRLRRISTATGAAGGYSTGTDFPRFVEPVLPG